MMKNWNQAIRIAAMLLTFVLCFGCIAGSITAQAAKTEKTTKKEDTAWMNNLITDKPLKAFGIEKKFIGTVTFLDDLEDAPKNAWNMGKGASSRVKGWIEWEDSKANVYFAAKGGINGKNCCEDMFVDCTELTEISFGGAFHTEEVTNMDGMFYGCSSLESVDTETLDTSKVTSMKEMFRDCVSLKELDVSTWNTEKVKNMYCMFSTCTALEELDLSSFDTGKVTNMSYMFSACKALEEVDVSSFDTKKVTNMEGMFRWCDMLEEPDLSGWNINKVRKHSNFMNAGMHIDGEPWEYFFK